MLTGIYLHKGVERAALARVDTKKKAEPPTYLQLVAGEKKDGIEIVSIDKATGKVTIKEFGELRSLSFKENTFKTSVAKAPRTSSRSSSSTAAKKATDIKKAADKKRAKMSESDRKKYAQQMRERFSSQGRNDGRSDRGGDGR
jgi:flagellar biosynthesis/type III secretory pathway protein FliH